MLMRVFHSNESELSANPLAPHCVLASCHFSQKEVSSRSYVINGRVRDRGSLHGSKHKLTALRSDNDMRQVLKLHHDLLSIALRVT